MVETHLFCEFCFERHIAPRVELKKRRVADQEKSFDHYYLFEWVPGESDMLSKMVYQLKSDRCVPALNYYAKLIADQMKLLGRLQRKIDLVVPLPGSTSKANHSNLFATAIATRFGARYEELFIKDQSQPSKNKESQATYGNPNSPGSLVRP